MEFKHLYNKNGEWVGSIGEPVFIGYYRTLEDSLAGEARWYVKAGKSWFGIPAQTAAAMANDHHVVLTDDPEMLLVDPLRIHCL